jgi:hypothetical protein
MNPKEIALKYKDFIKSVSIHSSVPQNDNIILNEIVDAWRFQIKELNAQIVINDCNSCNGGYIGAVKDFYVYATKNGWYNVSEKNVIETETITPKKNIKNKK